jgi:hypothetical protein
MNDDWMSDILDRHANLNQPNADALDLSSVLPQEREQAEELFQVAERAKHALTRVTPQPAFRARLHDGLMMAAHHEQTHRLLLEKPMDSNWGWLIGAAAIGSAAGIMAFMLRLRSQNQRVAPTSHAN